MNGVSVTINGKQSRGVINGNILMLESYVNFNTTQDGASIAKVEMRFANSKSPVIWTTHTGGMG